MMRSDLPRLAIMGHPNAGKSSVVATLTENDRIAIDQRAGTTTESDVYPVVIDGQTVIEFIDTPGFQNPSAILEWFQSHANLADLAGAFVKAHRHDALFAHDCALLEPVGAGAGIILVVDGSKRIKEKDRIEIELLRLTARPRMAILNNLTNQPRYVKQWQDALSKAFNSVREFNAHRATYAERMRLLNALKSIDQRWEPRLQQTVDAFARDWERRIDLAVGTILDLLKESLGFRYSESFKNNKLVFKSGQERAKAQVMLGFENGLRDLEARAQAEIRANFRHHVWNPPSGSLLDQDLLSEGVSRALGISRRQFAAAAAAAGAASGATIDLAAAGTSLGAAAFLGAAAGGLLGYLGGNTLAKLDIEQAAGTQRYSVGPLTNPRFPFVLLDRIILYSARAMNWSHGRQAADEDAADRVPDKDLPTRGFAEALGAAQQRALAGFFAAARRGKVYEAEDECRALIKGILSDLAEGRIDDRANL